MTVSCGSMFSSNMFLQQGHNKALFQYVLNWKDGGTLFLLWEVILRMCCQTIVSSTHPERIAADMDFAWAAQEKMLVVFSAFLPPSISQCLKLNFMSWSDSVSFKMLIFIGIGNNDYRMKQLR